MSPEKFSFALYDLSTQLYNVQRRLVELAVMLDHGLVRDPPLPVASSEAKRRARRRPKPQLRQMNVGLAKTVWWLAQQPQLKKASNGTMAQLVGTSEANISRVLDNRKYLSGTDMRRLGARGTPEGHHILAALKQTELPIEEPQA